MKGIHTSIFSVGAVVSISDTIFAASNSDLTSAATITPLQITTPENNL